jgi:signal transduction histidine kinase
MKDKDKSKEEFQKELDALHTVMDGLAVPVVVISKNQQLKLINRAARELLGVSEEHPPLTCYECFHGLDRRCDEAEVCCPMVEVQKTGEPVTVVHEHRLPDGSTYFHELVSAPFRDSEGNFLGIVETIHDVTKRKMLEDEREGLIAELQEALATIKTLRGLIPMCAWCRKVRDDNGYWKKVEAYVEEHSSAHFTHGICPECEENFKNEDDILA